MPVLSEPLHSLVLEEFLDIGQPNPDDDHNVRLELRLPTGYKVPNIVIKQIRNVFLRYGVIKDTNEFERNFEAAAATRGEYESANSWIHPKFPIRYFRTQAGARRVAELLERLIGKELPDGWTLWNGYGWSEERHLTINDTNWLDGGEYYAVKLSADPNETLGTLYQGQVLAAYSIFSDLKIAEMMCALKKGEDYMVGHYESEKAAEADAKWLQDKFEGVTCSAVRVDQKGAPVEAVLA